MAGIYIHYPFCKSRCYYCDFYSTTQLTKQNKYYLALQKELLNRKQIIGDSDIKTIYFGGGTPSLLAPEKIEEIVLSINNNFNITPNPEITIEVNPDDLTDHYLERLSHTSVNRISIGIQSFYDKYLTLMNRRHTSATAIEKVKKLKQLGYSNISIDLIFGIPRLTLKEWKHTLDIAIGLDVEHISAYHLTIEPKTVFNKLYKENKITLPKEQLSIDQFKYLSTFLEANNYTHYEISNFGKPNKFSQHNISYWNQQKYLGLGPSAHSYDGENRFWNESNLEKYISDESLKSSQTHKEHLTKNNKFNEYIMTRLRTIWGINLTYIKTKFGSEYYNHSTQIIKRFSVSNHITINDNNAVLTIEGRFISDSIIAELFII